MHFSPLFVKKEIQRRTVIEIYYYNHMNKTQQSAYHNILQGFQNMADEILIPRLEPEELYNVFFQLRLDHPEIFWATGFRYKYYQDSPNLIFVPEYLFEKNKVKEHQRAMQARVEKLVRPVKDKSEWEKEKFVHDFICENVRYDKLKKAYSHEIIGPLGQGVGVCEGIAKTVKILYDQLGIWCIVVISEANPEKNIKYRHAWNIVKIENVWYEVDATWDDAGSQEDDLTPGTEEYQYFMEALNDPEYREKLDHFLFLVSTDTITHFVPGDEYKYITSDGMYEIQMVQESVHIRLNNSEWGSDCDSAIIALAPNAMQSYR